MKKITLLFALLISSIGFSQEIVSPIYDGTFGGTSYSQTFNFPTGAENWAGFANNNVSIYPLSYPNGGQVSFKASVSTNAEIKFVFEKDVHPNVAPSVSTVNVTLLATNAANTVYTVAIPANATNTYKSALMYVVTRDVTVSLFEIKLIKFDTNGTTQLKVDFPIYDGIFGGSAYSQTFNFPTGAENWAGFANNNTAIYPLSFTNGGKVSFKATVATNAEIKFVFEKDIHPNVTPAVSTANVALLATNPANTSYEVAIPANATNTYKSALMYVTTRDVAVSLSEIKIHTNAPTAVCAGTSSDAQQGSLSNGGYNHKFETLANGDVQITFELLVAGAAGVVAYLWRDPAVGGFQELPMTVTGTTATKVITGLTSGQDISYAVKFVWAAGGFGVTKYFAYEVGNNCATAPPSAATYDLLESFNGTGLEGTFGEDGNKPSAAYAADPTIANTQVVKITSTNGSGATWQGVDVVLTTFYKLTAATQLTMQLDVYSTTAITIAPKAQGGEPGSPDSVTSASHTGSGWETLTLTFDKSLDGKVPANGIYGDFALHINWNATTNTFGTPDGRVFYIKNLKGLATQPTPDPNAPTTAAPTPPTRNAADVISLFSNAYTNINVGEWGTSWDSATITDVVIANDNVKKVNFGAFLGVDFTGNRINATDYTHFHIDIFTTTATLDKSFNHKLSNHANQAAGETSAIEFSTTNASNPSLPNPNPGTWISYDIPLSSFTIAGGGSLARDAIGQYLITSNLGIVYIDNIYFYRAATASLEDNIFNVSIYPNPASNRLHISAANTIQNAEIYNVLGKKVMNVTINKTSESIDISNLASGVYMIKYNIENTIGTAKFIKQ